MPISSTFNRHITRPIPVSSARLSQMIEPDHTVQKSLNNSVAHAIQQQVACRLPSYLSVNSLWPVGTLYVLVYRRKFRGIPIHISYESSVIRIAVVGQESKGIQKRLALIRYEDPNLVNTVCETIISFDEMLNIEHNNAAQAQLQTALKTIAEHRDVLRKKHPCLRRQRPYKALTIGGREETAEIQLWREHVNVVVADNHHAFSYDDLDGIYTYVMDHVLIK